MFLYNFVIPFVLIYNFVYGSLLEAFDELMCECVCGVDHKHFKENMPL